MSGDTGAKLDQETDEHLDHERWHTALESGTILGLRCDDCGNVTATPKAGCPRCGSRSTAVVELPERGTVYTKTTVEVAPPEHASGYQIALVDLADARILGRIADGERVSIGDEVRLCGTYTFREDVAAVFEPVG